MTDLLEMAIITLACPLLVPLVIEKQKQEQEEGENRNDTCRTNKTI